MDFERLYLYHSVHRYRVAKWIFTVKAGVQGTSREFEQNALPFSTINRVAVVASAPASENKKVPTKFTVSLAQASDLYVVVIKFNEWCKSFI